MKPAVILSSIFIALLLPFAASAWHSRSANITHDGKVLDSHTWVIGRFRSDGSIEDGHCHIIGYVCKDKVEDGSHNALGYIDRDGTITDRNRNLLGYISESGTVRNSYHIVIGEACGIRREWAAVYYFFNRFK